MFTVSLPVTTHNCSHSIYSSALSLNQFLTHVDLLTQPLTLTVFSQFSATPPDIHLSVWLCTDCALNSSYRTATPNCDSDFRTPCVRSVKRSGEADTIHTYKFP